MTVIYVFLIAAKEMKKPILPDFISKEKPIWKKKAQTLKFDMKYQIFIILKLF